MTKSPAERRAVQHLVEQVLRAAADVARGTRERPVVVPSRVPVRAPRRRPH